MYVPYIFILFKLYIEEYLIIFRKYKIINIYEKKYYFIILCFFIFLILSLVLYIFEIFSFNELFN